MAPRMRVLCMGPRVAHRTGGQTHGFALSRAREGYWLSPDDTRCPLGQNPPMERPRPVQLGDHSLGADKLFFLSGPCVLETRELAFEIAGRLKEILHSRGLPFIFTARFSDQFLGCPANSTRLS